MTGSKPVFVLTGFLGAGKTTLLNDLLSLPAFADTAVVINEFGDVPIDHELVGRSAARTIVSAACCICCAPDYDLGEALADLEQASDAGLSRPFSRVIIETSGLADPAPLINALLKPSSSPGGVRTLAPNSPYFLGGVITAVDMISGEWSIDSHFEATKQVAFADRIVLTKTDMAHDPATRKDLARLRQLLGGLNPQATIHDRHADGHDLGALFKERPYEEVGLGDDAQGWLVLEDALTQSGHRHDPGVVMKRHVGRIRSFAICRDEPLSQDGLARFLDLLKTSAGPKLLRVKGFACVASDPSRPRLIHCVQNFSPALSVLDAWPNADRRTRLMFIMDGIDEEPVKALLEAALSRGVARWRLNAVLARLCDGLQLRFNRTYLARHGRT